MVKHLDMVPRLESKPLAGFWWNLSQSNHDGKIEINTTEESLSQIKVIIAALQEQRRTAIHCLTKTLFCRRYFPKSVIPIANVQCNYKQMYIN